jgi:hypothetical protein
MRINDYPYIIYYRTGSMSGDFYHSSPMEIH